MIKKFYNEILTVFSEPKAYKKVIVSFWLGFFVALSATVSSQDYAKPLTSNDYTAICCIGFMWVFVLLWCATAGGFCFRTLGREIATGAWGALIHGLTLGTEQTGTWFFTIFSFTCMLALIPFILGLPYTPIFEWFQNATTKKKKTLAVVHNFDDAEHG